jgi:hypothetical protein
MQNVLGRQQLTDLEEQLRRTVPDADGCFIVPFAPRPVAAAREISPPPPVQVAAASPGPTGPEPRKARYDQQQQAQQQSERRAMYNWTPAQVTLYMTWWSFRPAFCHTCGSVDVWIPSADNDYICNRCMTGYNTRDLDIVDDRFNPEDELSEDDDDDGFGGPGVGAAANTAPEQSPLHCIGFYLPILHRLDAHLPGDIPVQHYPELLRVAVNVTYLLFLPDLPTDFINTVRCTAFYIACSLVVPSKVSFPLLQKLSLCDLQWMDVVHASRHVGLPPQDYYQCPMTHTRNLMALLPERPSSNVWDAEGNEAIGRKIDALRPMQREAFSPDHTAAIVTLELCREDDAVLESWMTKKSDIGKYTNPKLLEGTRASALLCYFAEAFSIEPLELCEMAQRSGLYRGPTFFSAFLKRSTSCGEYPLPLTRRCFPVESPWAVVFRALHSEDGLIVQSILHTLSAAPDNVNVYPQAMQTLQAIMHKHGSRWQTAFYYCMKVHDDAEAAMNGTYFCSAISRNHATYVCFNKKRSVRFKARTSTVYLNHPDVPATSKQQTSELNAHMVEPMVASIESNVVKLALDVAVSGVGSAHWADAQGRLHAATALRRRLQAHTNHVDQLCLLLDIRGICQQTAAAPADAAVLVKGGPPKVCLDEVARSFSIVAAAVPAPMLTGVPDAAVVRYGCELQLLAEADHPSLHRVKQTPRSQPALARVGSGKRSPRMGAVSPMPSAATPGATAPPLELPRSLATPGGGGEDAHQKQQRRRAAALLQEPRRKVLRVEDARPVRQLLKGAVDVIRH